METAKEILAEIFDVRVVEGDEMIRDRLEERSCVGKHVHLAEDGPWPTMFCIEG